MKIALFEPDAMSLWLFRAGIIRRLVADGHEVYGLCAADEYSDRVRSLGAEVIELDMSRFITPMADLVLVWRLYRLFREHRFDIVHTFTHKPNIYGAIAAKLAGCPRVVESVTGLGVLFTFKEGLGWWLARRVFMALSWLSFHVSDKAAFWNADIRARVLSAGLIREEKTVLIHGSGIDVSRFKTDSVDPGDVQRLRHALGGTDQTRFVLMVSRLVWGKGVAEFVESAATVERRCPDAMFLLAGPLEEEGHQGVPRDYIENRESPRFRWLGFRDDVRELMALADVVVLPSHGEGIPRSMLEAMAMGKPIVTTDTFGCRDVVDHGSNGFMVPLRNPDAVAEAVMTLLGDDLMRARMGAQGRRKVEMEFAEEMVVNRVFTELYGITG